MIVIYKNLVAVYCHLETGIYDQGSSAWRKRYCMHWVRPADDSDVLVVGWKQP